MTSRSHSGGRSEMRLARGFGVAAHTVSAARLGLQEGDDGQNATVRGGAIFGHTLDGGPSPSRRPWPTGRDARVIHSAAVELAGGRIPGTPYAQADCLHNG